MFLMWYYTRFYSLEKDSAETALRRSYVYIYEDYAIKRRLP